MEGEITAGCRMIAVMCRCRTLYTSTSDHFNECVTVHSQVLGKIPTRSRLECISVQHGVLMFYLYGQFPAQNLYKKATY